MRQLYSFLQRIVGYEQSVQTFVREIPFEKSASFDVLDAGCGNGLYTFTILRDFPNARVYAFDINKTITETVQKKLKEKSLEGRARVFNDAIEGSLDTIYGKEFDLIITAGVLEYVPLENTLRNLSRFLKLGGYFLNSPVRDTLWGKLVAWVYGCKPYTREQNIRAFSDNGFILEKLVRLPAYTPASFKEMHLFKKV